VIMHYINYKSTTDIDINTDIYFMLNRHIPEMAVYAYAHSC